MDGDDNNFKLQNLSVNVYCLIYESELKLWHMTWELSIAHQ
jgi:hypothetical protein